MNDRLTKRQRADLAKAIRIMDHNHTHMKEAKKHYKEGERVVCLNTGKHGWVASTSIGKHGETLHHIQYDRTGKDGVVGAPNMPWSLLRDETFMEYLFARKWSFGKWTLGQAVLVYGFLGIVGYGGARTITHFDQMIAGIAILAFSLGVVVGSIFLHYKNYHGKQA